MSEGELFQMFVILLQKNTFCDVTMWSITGSYATFYRAMHFSAKRGIAIACRLSVCL